MKASLYPASLGDAHTEAQGLSVCLTSPHLETPSSSPTGSLQRGAQKAGLPDEQCKQEKSFQGAERVKNQEGAKRQAKGSWGTAAGAVAEAELPGKEGERGEQKGTAPGSGDCFLLLWDKGYLKGATLGRLWQRCLVQPRHRPAKHPLEPGWHEHPHEHSSPHT